MRHVLIYYQHRRIGLSTTIKTSCQEMNISSEDEDSSILDDSDNGPKYKPDECTKRNYAFLSLKKTTPLKPRCT